MELLRSAARVAKPSQSTQWLLSPAEGALGAFWSGEEGSWPWQARGCKLILPSSRVPVLPSGICSQNPFGNHSSYCPSIWLQVGPNHPQAPRLSTCLFGHQNISDTSDWVQREVCNPSQASESNLGPWPETATGSEMLLCCWGCSLVGCEAGDAAGHLVTSWSEPTGEWVGRSWHREQESDDWIPGEKAKNITFCIVKPELGFCGLWEPRFIGGGQVGDDSWVGLWGMSRSFQAAKVRSTF